MRHLPTWCSRRRWNSPGGASGSSNRPTSSIASISGPRSSRPGTGNRTSAILPEISNVARIMEQGELQIRKYQELRNYAMALYKTDRCDLWRVDNLSSADGLRIAGRIPVRLQAVIPTDPQKVLSTFCRASARYYIAIIAGLVVGLFGSLAPPNLCSSPLAVAFLVGYAVEAFFSRLDDLIVKLKGMPIDAGHGTRSGQRD